MLVIRTIEERDAAAFVEVLRTIEAESGFMLFDPGERETTAEQQAQRIRDMRRGGSQEIFVAEADGELAGYLGATAGAMRRNRHAASFAMGVLERFSRRGIGMALLDALDEWARARRLHRVELTVISQNTRAIRLYERAGFVMEGTRRDALRIDGRFVDERWMSKLLPSAESTDESRAVGSR